MVRGGGGGGGNFLTGNYPREQLPRGEISHGGNYPGGGGQFSLGAIALEPSQTYLCNCCKIFVFDILFLYSVFNMKLTHMEMNNLWEMA